MNSRAFISLLILSVVTSVLAFEDKGSDQERRTQSAKDDHWAKHVCRGGRSIESGTLLFLKFHGIPRAQQAKQNGVYTVDRHGYIALPHLKDRILARGRTTTELEKLISRIYVQKKIHPGLELVIQR